MKAGSHYKPDFPERDDENWLKTTMAKYSPDGPIFSYDEVDISLIKPRKRVYDVDNDKGANRVKEVLFKIKRQNSPQEEPYWEEFKVPYRPNMNVVSALMAIQKHPLMPKEK